MEEAHSAALVTIHGGSLDPEELAALAAVLRRRAYRGPAAAADGASRRARTAARWNRPERAPGFDEPRAWQYTGRSPG